MKRFEIHYSDETGKKIRTFSSAEAARRFVQKLYDKGVSDVTVIDTLTMRRS